MLLGLLQQRCHLVQSVAIVTSFCCISAFKKKKKKMPSDWGLGVEKPPDVWGQS